jgi:hypothetical protein
MHIRLISIKVQTSERGKGVSAYDIFVPLSSHDKKIAGKNRGIIITIIPQSSIYTYVKTVFSDLTPENKFFMMFSINTPCST